MSHDAVDSAPATPLTHPGPGPAAVLGLIALAAAWHLVVGGLAPSHIWRDLGPLPFWVMVLVEMAAFAAYAVTLAVVARTARRRVWALAATAGAATVVVLQMLAFRHLRDHPEFLLDLSAVTPYLLTGLAVVAWGLARRTSPWWPAGLLATFGLVAFFASDTGSTEYDNLSSTILTWLDGAGGGVRDAASTTLRWLVGWLLPILAGGIAGWLLETYVRRSSTSRDRA